MVLLRAPKSQLFVTLVANVMGRWVVLWVQSPSKEDDLSEKGGTGITKINHATKELHDAMDALGPPPNIIYVGSQEIRGGSYDKVLSALRGLVEAGGKPFEDEEFKRFFNFLASPGVFRFKGKSPESERVLEQQRFVKTALRICGGEVKPDGSISLVPLSSKRRERN